MRATITRKREKLQGLKFAAPNMTGVLASECCCPTGVATFCEEIVGFAPGRIPGPGTHDLWPLQNRKKRASLRKGAGKLEVYMALCFIRVFGLRVSAFTALGLRIEWDAYLPQVSSKMCHDFLRGQI